MTGVEILMSEICSRVLLFTDEMSVAVIIAVSKMIKSDIFG